MQPMQPMQPFRRVPVAMLAVALSAGLAACGGSAPESTGITPERPDAEAEPLGPSIAPTPATRADGSAERAPAGGDAIPVPADVIVSTNEPFYQARVEGRTLVLTGVDVGERTLRIEASDFAGGARMIRARDARGTVEANVRAVACQDDMSGADFPMTGALTIDGDGPHRGCARPAGMPPPGEPGMAAAGAGALPAEIQGHWAPDAAACRNPDGSIEAVRIGPDRIRFHESVGVAREVHADADGAVRVRFDFEGEGERWEAEHVLRLDDNDTLQIAGPDDTVRIRVRCPA